MFSLFMQISWNNLLEATWKTLLETDLDFFYYILSQIELGLDLHSSSSIRKVPS